MSATVDYSPSSSGSSITLAPSVVSTQTLSSRLFSRARSVLGRGSEKRERLIALHDYEPTDPRRFLAFKKDEEFELVDAMNQDGWWLAKHLSSGKKGLIPSSFVARECDIELLGWCNLEYTRNDAIAILNEKLEDGSAVYRSGSFIIRSSSSGSYSEALSLSIKSSQDTILHYTIVRDNGLLRIAFQNRGEYVEVAFPKLTKLVQYYARYPSAVRHRLTCSVKKKIDAWEIDISEIDKGERLGKGFFGEVYVATLDGWKVAVKSLLLTNEDDIKQFKQEAETARRLSHENIVRIIGLCTTPKELSIVTEFLPGKDLSKYLKQLAEEETPPKTLSQREYLEIARKIASAMAHLERNNIVHRDLAARNVLVGLSLDIIKLADFGLARDMNDKTYYRSQKKEFPYKWTAPEAFVFYGPDRKVAKEGCYSSASDVWSFAVVLWEVYNMGALPYADKENHLIYDHLMEGNVPLERPSTCPEETVFKMMRQCWSLKAAQRPTFATILLLIDNYSNMEAQSDSEEEDL